MLLHHTLHVMSRHVKHTFKFSHKKHSNMCILESSFHMSYLNNTPQTNSKWENLHDKIDTHEHDLVTFNQFSHP